MKLSQSEENYLKALARLQIEENVDKVSTNLLAEVVQAKASSVTDMLRKLAEKKLVDHRKYRGVELTRKGRTEALKIIRKHRLWEVFLVEHLQFSWDEVHEVAEQLEHIKSEKLINNLEDFLGSPTVDPHGDLIPDRTGKFAQAAFHTLAELKSGNKALVTGVKDHSTAFLQFLDKMGVSLGSELAVVDINPFDHSIMIEHKKKQVMLSAKAAQNLLVKEI